MCILNWIKLFFFYGGRVSSFWGSRQLGGDTFVICNKWENFFTASILQSFDLMQGKGHVCQCGRVYILLYNRVSRFGSS